MSELSSQQRQTIKRAIKGIDGAITAGALRGGAYDRLQDVKSILLDLLVE